MRQLEESSTYVNYLLAEHRQLDGELHGIQASLRSAQPEEVLRRLTLLRDELGRHFADEEAGGCLEEAISHCPNVSHQADALLDQHPALITKLNHLIGRLQPLPAQLGAGFDQELGEFTKELLVHEAMENQIMRRAFGITMNGNEE